MPTDLSFDSLKAKQREIRDGFPEPLSLRVRSALGWYERAEWAGDGRAVTLVTHLRVNGLEWPAVLAVDLDSEIRLRLWRLSVLQYWPWRFGLQSAGIPVCDSAESSAAGIAAKESGAADFGSLGCGSR